jgi:hypothetical protein
MTLRLESARAFACDSASIAGLSAFMAQPAPLESS